MTFPALFAAIATVAVIIAVVLVAVIITREGRFPR